MRRISCLIIILGSVAAVPQLQAQDSTVPKLYSPPVPKSNPNVVTQLQCKDWEQRLRRGEKLTETELGLYTFCIPSAPDPGGIAPGYKVYRFDPKAKDDNHIT
jgi:hypothetical protein